VLYRYQYTYDGVGNRLTETNTGQITYTYDNNNKLTQLVGPGGTTTFGYDNNGNTTSMTQPGPVTTTYGYSYENRLTSVTNPGYTAAYTYSADGLRLRVQESNNPNPDRWLQYDGVRPVLEGTLSGDTFTTVNKYVWEGESYYDPLLYSLIGGAWRYHMYDGLGSTRQLMLHFSPYTVTDTYSYEAFGNLMASTGTTANPYKYVGSLGYYQTGSSLMHLGGRHYVRELGRFTARDVFQGSDSQYAYCAQNPLYYSDPTGWLLVNIGGFPNVRRCLRLLSGVHGGLAEAIRHMRRGGVIYFNFGLSDPGETTVSYLPPPYGIRWDYDCPLAQIELGPLALEQAYRGQTGFVRMCCTLAHELMHVWQGLNWGPGWSNVYAGRKNLTELMAEKLGTRACERRLLGK